MTQSKKYIPQLDGVRAIAVISIIIFHFNPNVLPGGFIGVDLFFVLSSYLITSIIIGQKKSDFSFTAFYSKRIKRILPPLYLMLLVGTSVGFLIMAKQDFEYLKDSIGFIILFSANLFFTEQGDYIGAQILDIPFLHAWSLSIEEQFYFLWPGLLLLILKLKGLARVLVPLLLAILGISYGEWLLQTPASAHMAYYSSFACFGRMLLGATAAIYVAYKDNKISPFCARVLLYFGFVIFAFSMFLISKESGYPGFLSFIPSLGSVFIIVGAHHSGADQRQLLAIPLLVWVGRVSYSLYLWHWPVLVYFRYVTDNFELSLKNQIWAILTIVALSFFSYYVVEERTRYSKIKFKSTISYYLILPAISLLVLAFSLSEFLRKIDKSPNVRLYSTRCHNKVFDSCRVGNQDAQKPRILAFGDSHMSHLNGFIEAVAKKEGWAADVISVGGCIPVFDTPEDILLLERRYQQCKDLHQWVRRHLNDYDAVLVAGRWEKYYESLGEEFFKDLSMTLNELSQNGRRVYLFNQVRPSNVSQKNTSLLLKVTSRRVYPNVKIVNDLLKDRIPKNVVQIDLFNISLQLDQNSKNYFDGDHLNETGSVELSKLFLSKHNYLFSKVELMKTSWKHSRDSKSHTAKK